jgi:hypothetical protein
VLGQVSFRKLYRHSRRSATRNGTVRVQVLLFLRGMDNRFHSTGKTTPSVCSWYCAWYLSCRALFQTAFSSCEESREYSFATTCTKIKRIKRPSMASVANHRMHRLWYTLFVLLNICVEHSRLRKVIYILDRTSLYCFRRYVFARGTMTSLRK